MVTPAARFSRCRTPPACAITGAGHDRAAALRAEDRDARVVRAEREAGDASPGASTITSPAPRSLRIEDRLHADERVRDEDLPRQRGDACGDTPAAARTCRRSSRRSAARSRRPRGRAPRACRRSR